MNNVVFGYWDCQGSNEHIRHLLAYLGISYQSDDVTQEKWFSGGNNALGLEFPNLPYLLDEKRKLTESKAIVQYICQRSNRPDLLGKTPKDHTYLATLHHASGDLTSCYFPIITNPNYNVADLRTAAEGQKLGGVLEKFSKTLGDKEYFTGYLTVFDIKFASMFHVIRSIYKSNGMIELADKFGNLLKHYNKVRGLQGIKEHIMYFPRSVIPKIYIKGFNLIEA